MKFTGVVIALIFGSAHASMPSLPAHFCQGDCSIAQEQIWEEFLNGTTLDQQQIPAIFNGKCYFLSASTEPDQVIYAVMAFDKKKKQTYFGGEFSYWVATNPYTQLSVSDAIKEGIIKYDNVNRVFHFADHAEVELSDSPEHSVHYWFRKDRRNGDLLVILQGEGEVRGFCELPAGPKNQFSNSSATVQ